MNEGITFEARVLPPMVESSPELFLLLVIVSMVMMENWVRFGVCGEWS
jgi:hypothetical protein